MSAIVNQKVDFTEGKITPKLIKFAIPIMLTGLLQMLYNASDMIVVGNFAENGTNAVGGIGACTSLITMIIGLFLGLSVGAGVVTAKNIGARRFDNVKDIITTSLLLAVVCGIFVAIFGFIFCKPLLVFMGTPDDILVEAVPYMQAYFIGVPFNLSYLFLAAIVRSSGDSKTPLIILGVAGIFNVITNLVMVLVFNMGAIGVSIATVCAQTLSLIIIAIYLARKNDYLKLSFKNLKVNKNILTSIITIGLPAGLQTTIFAISNVLIQSTINSYGPEAVSGNAAAANLEGFTYTTMNAFYQATLTFVGQHMGARKYDRIPKITLSAVILVVVIGSIMGNTIYLLGDTLLSIYEPESVIVREWGLKRLSIVSTFHCLCGVFEVGSAVLRGMGKSFLSMIISLIGSVLLRIVWIFTICALIPNNIVILYISYPVSWTITVISMYAFVFVMYKKLIRQKEKDLQEKLA